MEKYVVAASIIEKNTGKLSLGHTTLMPNIRGFGVLIAMIFSPCVEMQCNKSRTRYTSILTGLGYDSKQNRPVYEEHDVHFDLDLNIDAMDFESVSYNSARESHITGTSNP